MNFDPSPENEMLRDMAARLFTDLKARSLAEQRDALAEAGLLDLAHPDSGCSPSDLLVVAEEAGRHLLDFPLIALTVPAARLPHARTDELVACVPHCFSLSPRGVLPPVLDGGLAQALVVHSASGVLRLERDSRAVLRKAPDGRTSTSFDLASPVSIPRGEHELDLLSEGLDRAIVATCSEMIGAMDALLALTVDYLNTRRQFGVPLGTFQALQHRAADMLVAIEQARSITIAAIAALDAERAARTVAGHAAKALVNRSAKFVGEEAIQLHGGMGLASEYPAGAYYRRLVTLERLFGDTDHHLAEVERLGGVAFA